ncbi:hypothetical protein VPH35_123290 [Triticum aestivum]
MALEFHNRPVVWIHCSAPVQGLLCPSITSLCSRRCRGRAAARRGTQTSPSTTSSRTFPNAPKLLPRPMASVAPELCCRRRQQQQHRRRLPPLLPCARPLNPVALRRHRHATRAPPHRPTAAAYPGALLQTLSSSDSATPRTAPPAVPFPSHFSASYLFSRISEPVLCFSEQHRHGCRPKLHRRSPPSRLRPDPLRIQPSRCRLASLAHAPARRRQVPVVADLLLVRARGAPGLAACVDCASEVQLASPAAAQRPASSTTRLGLSPLGEATPAPPPPPLFSFSFRCWASCSDAARIMFFPLGGFS